VPGFAPGSTRPGRLPTARLTGDYLIESIHAEWAPGADAIRYSVNAISGDTFGSWQAYFRRLLKIGRQFVINENEVVVGLQEFDDAMTVSDALVESSGYPVFRVGTARVGFSVVRAA
jgi:hypothetical protein